MSVKASCSACQFSRRFSDELAGKFYRCPKCREGVIAVPVLDPSASEEVPLRLSSSSFENPFLEVAKKNPKSDRGETLEMTAVGSTAEGSRLQDDDSVQVSDSVSREAVEALAGEAASATLPEGTVLSPDRPPDNRGEVATARRILVECGLCGFLVRIPAEFFGKTVHCPECAGNTIFTESTLDPVKDELLDRAIMETQERALLFPKPGSEGQAAGLDLTRLREYLGSNAIRSFLIGVGLGLLVLVAAFGITRARRANTRQRVVDQATQEGWRYATAVGGSADVFHEPWCRDLDVGTQGRVGLAEFRQLGSGASLHDCK